MILFINFLSQIFGLFRLLLNHLVNIPLILFAGYGKYAAIIFAFVVDMLQAVIYTKILKASNFRHKISPFILKLFPSIEKMQIKHYSNFRKLQYLGIFLLASLPVYTGGICAASFLRYTSSLNKYKSLLAMVLGSLTGCILWVFGINWFFNFLRKFIF
ncbi:MAG: small multi-drug export protein [Endomicrobia bacterium]|nr:small multi-drug export protein [Endomicrobiia bacterium]